MKTHFKVVLLALATYGISNVEALAITSAATSTESAVSPTTSLTSTTPAPALLPSTTTSTTKTTTSQTYLYLPISTASPDSIGLIQVSGFYGPGAWAAWWLTIVASWIRLIREAKGKIDANMWFYLLGTNWAGIDLLRCIARASSLGGKETVEGMMQMAQIGAAVDVLWWGIATAMPQFCFVVAFCTDAPDAKKGRQLLITLLIGLFVPGVALTVALFTVTDWPIPALYYTGILQGDQQQTLTYACGSGLCCLICVVTMGFANSLEYLPKIWQTRITACADFVNDKVLKNHSSAYMITSFIVAYAVTISWIFISPFYLLWFLIPFIPAYMLSTIIFPAMAYMMTGVLAVSYIWNAYTPWGKVKISQSCYFMPCAPASIKDSDQAFALMAGLVTLIGTEIAPQLWKEATKRREALRTQAAALQDAGERIEMARRTNSGVTRRTNSGLRTPV